MDTLGETILVAKTGPVGTVVILLPKITVKVPLPVLFVILHLELVTEILAIGQTPMKQAAIIVQEGYVLIMGILARGTTDPAAAAGRCLKM
ncbi:hypothetical protein HY085_00475 [Candidatus Gottesmanbacteria bacterium]|nr:hypothetical protein [Candidatus Gottesmanbacteria bacterium]